MGCAQTRDKNVDYAKIFDSVKHGDYSYRELQAGDYNKGFWDTFRSIKPAEEQNSEYNHVNEKEFQDILEHINGSGYIHKIIVAEYKGKIVGTGAIFIEPKFIHKGGKVGHIEDLAVLEEHKKPGVSDKIVNALKDIGIDAGCYKIIVNCKEEKEHTEFFNKKGFHQKNHQMAHYISETEQKELKAQLERGLQKEAAKQQNPVNSADPNKANAGNTENSQQSAPNQS